jgi:DNA-binding MarR family transcriptional regulator
VRQLEQHILQLMSHAQHAVNRIGAHKTPTGVRIGLTSLQIAVLAVVFRQENPTMSEVAADQYVHRPAATRLVSELVTRKLIARVPDPVDRRVVRLHLTPKGRTAVDRIHAELGETFARVLQHMTDAERQGLLLGLTGFIRAVTAIEAEGES